MSTVELFSQISLAEATYANLTGLDINSSQNLLSDRLVAVNNGFSRTQADEFAKHWRVVNHQPDTLSGFSATLFESIDNPGEFTFAIRGTAGPVDLVIADGMDIVLDGIALDQVVDMYNYWQRLKAPENQSYQVARLVELSELSSQLAAAFLKGEDVGETLAATLGAQPGIIVDFPTLTVKAVVFEQSAEPDGLGAIPADLDGINVAGHSLGGHLAMAFTRLFEEDNPTAYTANGAGFRIHFNVDNLLNALAQAETSFDDNRIINLFGTAGLNFVTQDVFLGLNQEGIRIPVFTESTFKGTLGHGVGQVTDSAVVYDLMIALDPVLQALPPLSAINRLTPVFEAASNQADFSVESLVNALGKLLVPSFSEIKKTEEDNREVLYSRIQSIRQAIFVNPDVPSPVLNPKFQGLTITPLNALASEIKVKALGLSLDDPADAIAYRYALKELNPFVITGNNALYENNHNQKGELDPENFSEDYLTDAAEFLALKIELGIADTNSKAGRSFNTQVYQKLDDTGEQELELRINNFGPGGPRNQFFSFGGAGNDTLEGGSREDHLYGNSGDDELIGKAGRDILEGNLGDDTLYGGSKVGESTVDDGVQDTLRGGDGNDTYHVGQGDVIDDSDGQGIIQYRKTDNSEVTVSGRTYTLKQDNIYESQDDDQLRVQFDPITNTLQVLGATTFTIQNFQDGDFNITLDGEPEAITYDTLLTGTDANDGSSVFESTALNDEIRTLAGDDRAFGGAGRDLLVGGGGDDRLSGNSDDDIIQGDADNDVLFGGSGDDSLSGGAETDILLGGSDNDIINGGAGIDVLLSGDGRDTLLGGAGTDLLIANGDASVGSNWDVTLNSSEFELTAITLTPGQIQSGYFIPTGMTGGNLFGSDGDDLLIGSEASDTLEGEAGNDTIEAGDGNDVIRGGDGIDLIVGDGDNDQIEGGAGNDRIFGDSALRSASEFTPGADGNDFIDAGEGDDTVFGGAGDDKVLGDAGDDELFGGEGNDTLDGGTGNDELQGNEGDDVLAGGADTDLLVGGDGNDFLDGGSENDLLAGEAGNDSLFGGDGSDELQGGDGEDIMAGGTGDDRLFGQGDNDRLSGGLGNDELQGGEGDDVLEGEAGDDLLAGQVGNDTLTGGLGNDNLQGNEGDDSLDGGDDNDLLFGGADNDNLQGGSGNDVLLGGAGNDALAGGQGADELQGEAGEDSLNGGDGNDLLFGGANNDLLAGGSGDDQLVGGEGNDTLGGGTEDDFLFGEGGDDELDGGDGDDELQGGTGNDILTAGSGDDLLFGNEGDDTLDGGHGQDRLVDDDGNDNLNGGDASDIMIGGAGGDILEGGLGHDKYIYQAGDGHDVITDAGAYDLIFLQGGINQTDVTITEDGADILITLDTNNSLRLVEGANTPVVDALVFSDGSTLTADNFLTGTSSGQHFNVNAASGSNIKTGTSGDDIFNIAGRTNVFDGGQGDDAYFFHRSTGSQQITDTSGTDALVFGDDIEVTDLLPQLQDGNLTINIGDDQIEIEDWENNRVERFVFSDGTELTAGDFDLLIKNAPSLTTPISDQVTDEDAAFSFQIPAGTFVDPDGDSLNFEASLPTGDPLPAWLSFDPATRILNGTPTNDDVGSIDIEITATDPDAAFATDSFTLTVNNTNDTPEVAFALPDRDATENFQFEYKIQEGSIVDPDVGDGLTFTATLSDGSALPDWLTFDADTRSFNGIPATADISTLSIKVTATDTAGASVSDEFDLTVDSASDKTVVTRIQNSGGRVIHSSRDSVFDPFQFASIGVFDRRIDTNPALDEVDFVFSKTGGPFVQDNLNDFAFYSLIGTGQSVSAVGDVNGDGLNDFAVGVQANHVGGGEIIVPREAYLVYGKEGGLGETFDLTTINGTNASYIFAPPKEIVFGLSRENSLSVHSLGDINGDGLSDLAIRDAGTGSDRDNDVVLFGRENGFGQIKFLGSTNGSDGFRVNRATAIGDINQDGFDDLMIDVGSRNIVNDEIFVDITKHLLLGQAAGFASAITPENVDNFNTVRLDTLTSGMADVTSIETVGDINGDGRDDVLAADSASNHYIVFDQITDINNLLAINNLDGQNGVSLQTISGIGAIKAVGDVNGDGLADLRINDNTGATSIVFGQDNYSNAMINIDGLDGANGFKIADNLSLVSSGGDVDGDSINDFLFKDGNELRVVFGQNDGFSGNLAISSINEDDSFRIATSAEATTYSLEQDINGDGFADIILGAPTSNTLGSTFRTEGESFILYGRDFRHKADFVGSDGDDLINVENNDVVIKALPGNDHINVFNGQNVTIDAGRGDDQINIYGGGFHSVTTGIGNNTIAIELGNNSGVAVPGFVFNITGGADSDNYFYTGSSTAGTITIKDDGPRSVQDRMRFGFGLDAANPRLGLGSLKLTFENDPAEIHLESFNPDDVLGGPRDIDIFEFTDATLTYEQLVSRGFDVEGSEEDDALTGTNVTDRLNGFAGNDVLSGGDGDDTLTGGRGDNVMDGGTGGDTYRVNLGDGTDIINDVSGIDRIEFGDGIAVNNISVEKADNDLVIHLFDNGQQTTNSLTITDWFLDNDRKIELFRFANNTLLSATDIENLIGAGQNNPPTVESGIGDQVTDEDVPFNFAIPQDAFTDPDSGDTLTFAASLANGDGLPGWLTFDPVTQTFSGTPNNNDVDSIDFLVTATDAAGESVSDSFSLTVNNVNDVPLVQGPGIEDQITDEDQVFSFIIPQNSFTDDDITHGDKLTLTAMLTDDSPLPDWLVFDPATQTFSGTPANGDVGDLAIKVTATDAAGASQSDIFNLTVNNVNDAPVLMKELGDQETVEGERFEYQLPAAIFTDDDAVHGDVLHLTAALADGSALPDWLSFDADSQTFNGEVPFDAAGIIDIRVTATDLAGTSVSDTFSLDIVNVINGNNRPNWLRGTEGKDIINGFGRPDWLFGRGGDDVLNAGGSNDKLFGGDGDDILNGGNGHDWVQGEAGHDRLFGGEGHDKLVGGNGIDALFGEWSNDWLGGGYQNDYLAGGSGADRLDGGADNDFLAGGAGSDRIEITYGNDVVAYNRGDGEDRLNIDKNVEHLTLSLGGGIALSDIALERRGNDLIIDTHDEASGKDSGWFGGWRSWPGREEFDDDQLILENWFGHGYYPGAETTDVTLQLIVDASAEYDPESTDPLLNRRIQSFSLNELARQFEAANGHPWYAQQWSASQAYVDAHIEASDDEASGGELAYQYAHRTGRFKPEQALLQETLGSDQFGNAKQAFVAA